MGHYTEIQSVPAADVDAYYAENRRSKYAPVASLSDAAVQLAVSEWSEYEAGRYDSPCLGAVYATAAHTRATAAASIDSPELDGSWAVHDGRTVVVPIVADTEAKVATHTHTPSRQPRRSFTNCGRVEATWRSWPAAGSAPTSRALRS